MRVFITGGAGFIGSAVVRELRARGDEVSAAVRKPDRARVLRDLGCRLVGTDLSSTVELTGLMAGSDAIIHAAGSYRVGIPDRDRPAMADSNVGATTRVIAAARAAGIPRILYLSTVNVLGNTHGEVVDETFRRDPSEGFLSWYDETKYQAHLIAEAQIAGGAPVVIAMPGQVYGPGDHSAVGQQLAGAVHGRLAYLALTDVGLCFVHVDDMAAGLLAALDLGRIGESYVLDGEPVRLINGLRIAARLGGHRLPAGGVTFEQLVERRAPGLGPHHHACTAAVGGVVHGAMVIICPRP